VNPALEAACAAPAIELVDWPSRVVGSTVAMFDLDTRLLRAFVTVADELNFTRAAGRLFVAQQALSAQIQQLEGRLGVRLFERTTRKVSLTDAGEQLLPHAVATLAALDAGVGQLEATRRAEIATLRVGLSGTATVPVASATMRLFARRQPEVNLVVSNAGLNQPAAGLMEGTVDVAFVRPPFLDTGLSMVTVLTEERFAVLREDHPLAGREYVRPEDLVGEPWIWVEGADPRARAFWSLEAFRSDKPLRTGTRVNSFEEAFGAVAAGLAITCQAESAVRAVATGFPELRFVPLRGAPPAQVAVAWRTAHETPTARAFVEMALEVSRRAPD
jgi:DNA-binding transcriptional LysR family regulator